MNTAENINSKDLASEVLSLKNENSFLKEQLDWFKRQVFGQRSEKIISDLNSQQLEFEGFSGMTKETEEETKNVAAHTRRKSVKGKDKITLSPDLPVETVILDIPEEEKTCRETGLPLKKIGEEITHKIAHKPGSFYIKEFIRPKYAYPQKDNGILVANLPDSILLRCRADESLLAEIVTKKFGDHLPLYRQTEIFSRSGVGISRKLLSQWVLKVGLALEPLYKIMYKKVLDSGNVFIDESPVKLQNKEKTKQTYMWVLVGGEGANPPYRVYDFRQSRSHKHVFEILSDYKEVLHSDKYAAYEVLAQRKQIKWCPCWSHIRRKFFEAQTDSAFRDWVLRKIRYLFMLEKIAWTRSGSERLKIRQEKEIPIIDELIEKIKMKLQEGKILPKSKLREALGYFCGLIPYLKTYTKYSNARLDNNVAERAIRPLAIGRKNWMFIGSPDSGKATAILLSLVQTCRGLNINPREYLEDIMRRLMGHNSQKLQELLPDQWLLGKNKV
jgi:transposase